MLTAEFIRIYLPLEHFKNPHFKKIVHLFLYQHFCKQVCHFPLATSHCTVVVHVLSHSYSAKESLERNRTRTVSELCCVAVSATKLQCGIFCFWGQILSLYKITAGGSNASIWSDSSPAWATEIQLTVCFLFNNHHRKPTGCQEAGLVC